MGKMPLASFIQKFSKLKQLFDWHNHALLNKVDVYFGKGKAPNANVQSPHYGQQYHSQQDSGGSTLYRAQSNVMPFQMQSVQSNQQMNGGMNQTMYNQQQLAQQLMYPQQSQQQQQQPYGANSNQQITYSHSAYM